MVELKNYKFTKLIYNYINIFNDFKKCLIFVLTMIEFPMVHCLISATFAHPISFG